MSLLQYQASNRALLFASSASDCIAWDNIDTAAKITQSLNDNGVSDFPDWLVYCIGAVGLCIGLFEVFAGYKFWPVTIFLLAGYICAVVTYSLIMTFKSDLGLDSTDADYYANGFGLLAWLIGGLFFSYYRKLAAFVIGAGMGVLGALFLQPLFFAYIWKDHPNAVLYIMMVLLGFIGGVLVLYMERPLVITSTAFIGSFIFIAALSTFGGGMPDFGSDNFEELAKEGVGCVPAAVWGYAAGLISLFVIGVVVQFKHTAKDLDHGAPRQQRKARTPQEEGLITSDQAPVQYV